MAKMSVDDKLGFDKFVTDEHESHIQINEDYHDEAEIKRLVMACPANLYHYDDGKLVFSHEGCLECGTCRVISGGKGVKSWKHPKGAMGVEFHQADRRGKVKKACRMCGKPFYFVGVATWATR